MTNVVYPVLFFIYNTLIFALWILTVALIFPLRRHPRTVVIVLALCLAFYFSLNLLPFMSNFRLLGGILVVGIPAFVLYEGKWYHKLLIVMMILVSVVVEELLIYFILPEGILYDVPSAAAQAFIYLFSLFTDAFLLALIVLTSRMIRRHHSTREISRVSLLFMLFPLSQYLAFTGWLKPISTDSANMPVSYLLVLVVQILADVGLVYAMAATSRNGELRAQNRLLQSQVRDQQEYYAALAEHYRNVRRMRHDIDNHIYTIQSLLEDGKQNDAARYTEQLVKAQQAEKPVLEGCENTVAASFLLHRQKELEEKGIRLRCEVALPAQPGLDEIDLICALGNMLDNAEEACAGLAAGGRPAVGSFAPSVSSTAGSFAPSATELPTPGPNPEAAAPEGRPEEEPEITLRMELQDSYLSLKVENPCSPTSPAGRTGGDAALGRAKIRRIPELERGVGQTILQQLAEKYDGEFHTAEEGNRYIATLILKRPG